jgi:hypothetical protein
MALVLARAERMNEKSDVPSAAMAVVLARAKRHPADVVAEIALRNKGPPTSETWAQHAEDVRVTLEGTHPPRDATREQTIAAYLEQRRLLLERKNPSDFWTQHRMSVEHQLHEMGCDVAAIQHLVNAAIHHDFTPSGM